MIFYTDKFVPEKAAAVTTMFLTFIRPKYKDDIGIHEHEKVHRKQFYRTLGVHTLLYIFFDNYKLKSEIEAYQKQLEFPPAIYDYEKYVNKYAKMISTGYGLNVDHKDVLNRLKGN